MPTVMQWAWDSCIWLPSHALTPRLKILMQKIYPNSSLIHVGEITISVKLIVQVLDTQILSAY